MSSSERSAAQGREPTRIPMGGVDKCLLCGWQGQPDEPHGCPRYTDSAATWRNVPVKPLAQTSAGICGMHGCFVGVSCPKCVTQPKVAR